MMRYSNINWIQKLPDGWNEIPFKSVFMTNTGITFTKSDLVEEGTSVISYGQIHAKDNPSTTTDTSLIRHIPNDLSKGKENALLNVGDFLFADTSEDKEGCGNHILIDKDNIYGGYHTIIAKSSFKGCPKFLSYLFLSDPWRLQIRLKVYGVKLYSVTQTILNQTTIVYPSLKEQQAIANYLDEETDKLRRRVELLEKKRDAYLRLRRSLINHVVTHGLNKDVVMKGCEAKWIDEIPSHWQVMRLSNFFHSNTLLNKDFKYRSAFKFYQGTIVPKDENFEEEDYKETYEKYTVVEKDDIIVNGLNLNYDLKSMRVGRVPENGIITSAYVVLRPYNKEFSNYYTYLFKSFDYRKFFHGMGKGVRLTLSFNELKVLMIPVPPLAEQQEIAAYLDEKCTKIDAIVANIDQQIERTKQLQRSLINEVITGQRSIN